MTEPAPKIKPWLLPFTIATAGIYLLLAALAIGGLAAVALRGERR